MGKEQKTHWSEKEKRTVEPQHRSSIERDIVRVLSAKELH